MKQYNALLENLARSSLRLNKGMTVLLGLALLLAGFSLWSLERLIDEHSDTVSIHFARLMENVQEQETFLEAPVQRSAKGSCSTTHVRSSRRWHPCPRKGRTSTRARSFHFPCRSASNSTHATWLTAKYRTSSPWGEPGQLLQHVLVGLSVPFATGVPVLAGCPLRHHGSRRRTRAGQAGE